MLHCLIESCCVVCFCCTAGPCELHWGQLAVVYFLRKAKLVVRIVVQLTSLWSALQLVPGAALSCFVCLLQVLFHAVEATLLTCMDICTTCALHTRYHTALVLSCMAAVPLSFMPACWLAIALGKVLAWVPTCLLHWLNAFPNVLLI